MRFAWITAIFPIMLMLIMNVNLVQQLVFNAQALLIVFNALVRSF